MPIAIERTEVRARPREEEALFCFAVVVGKGDRALHIRQDNVTLPSRLAEVVHSADHQLPALIRLRDAGFRALSIETRYSRQQRSNQNSGPQLLPANSRKNEACRGNGKRGEDDRVPAAYIGVDPANGRGPDRGKREQKQNASVVGNAVRSRGPEVPEQQKSRAEDKSNQHGFGDVTLGENVLENVPGVRAGKVKDALLVELIKRVTERSGPHGKVVSDFRNVSQIQKQVNPHTPDLADHPRGSQISRPSVVRNARQGVDAGRQREKCR